MADLEGLDIVSAGAAIREGTLGCEELAQASLDRIERLEPQLHAYYALTADHALLQARQADREISAGTWRGPLHGVPIGIKDLYRTSFAPTTGGLSHRRSIAPGRNAFVVQRLEDAGAVILGKLATTEGAFIEHNPDWPTPRNPWSHDHWAGLSSSGSGVAVAARMCLGALGSDTGGSIRFPSAACGITGLKPTFGLVSGAGVLALSYGFDHFGPMTLTAADAALMLSVIAGYDREDPRTEAAGAIPDYFAALSRGAEGVRIGVDPELLEKHLDPVIASRIGEAIAVLVQAGAAAVPVRFPAYDDMRSGFSDIMAREAADAHAEAFPEHERSYGPALAQLIRDGMAIDGPRLERARMACARWNEAFSRTMTGIDMLALPVLAKPTPAIESLALGKSGDIGAFTIPFDVSGSPTINFPVGFDLAGLPVALQLIGQHHGEAALLRAGHAYQMRTGWHRMLPPSLNK